MATFSDVTPRVGDVKAAMPAGVRQRSTVRAILLFLPIVALFLASEFAAIAAPWWPLKIVFSGTTAFFLALLFVIGHDACHGAYTPSQWLNAILGRIAFLPAWHTYVGWEHTHNHVHHGYTNLRSREYVWAPLTKAEYDRRSPWVRFLVRQYRSWYGFGLYYFFHVYLPHILFPWGELRGRNVARYVGDFLLVAAYVGGQAAAILAISNALEMTNPWYEQLFYAQWLPFLIWNYLIGFLIYLHHTHPRIPWFEDEHQWNFYRGQVQGTAHVLFPGPINWIIGNIMEHTAHHADPKVPLYHLDEAQRALEVAFRSDIVEHKFSFRSLLYGLRVCQLYDFENHCWVNWAGEPTSSRTVRLHQSPPGVAPVSSDQAQA